MIINFLIIIQENDEKNKNIKFGYGMQYAVLHTYNGGRNNND